MLRCSCSKTLSGIFTLAIGLFMSLPVAAQDNPVSFETKVSPNSSDEVDFVVTVNLDIAAGWHTYASVPDGNPSPVTSIEFELPDGVTLSGELDKPKGSFYPDDPEMTVYEGKVKFSQGLRSMNSEAVEVGVKVEFQVCTSDRCLPPDSWDGTVEIPASAKDDESETYEFKNEHFEAPVRLMVDDVPLNVAASQMYPSPAMFDVDDDGEVELVTGDIFGSLNVYENTGTGKEPVWASHTPLESCEGKPIKVSNW